MREGVRVDGRGVREVQGRGIKGVLALYESWYSSCSACQKKGGCRVEEHGRESEEERREGELVDLGRSKAELMLLQPFIPNLPHADFLIISPKLLINPTHPAVPHVGERYRQD